jgi:hypothetical protein
MRLTGRELFSLMIVGLLLAATAYEAAVALKWISMGSAPGEGAPGEDVIRWLGTVAIPVASFYSASLAVRSHPSVAADSIIPVAAAGLVAARFYSFDPYYLPTLRRFSDAGVVADALIYALLALALLVAVLIRVRRRLGLGAAAVLLVVCVGTLVFMGGGH